MDGHSNFTVYYCIYVICREAPWASLAADTDALQIAITIIIIIIIFWVVDAGVAGIHHN